MSVTITVDIRGLPELIAKSIKPVHADPFRRAMVNSINALEKGVKDVTPRVTGNLQRSIGQKIDSAPLPLWGEVGLMRPSGGPVAKGGSVRYGIIVHEGSKPHVIRPRRAKALFWPGARHPVRMVRHPGTKPNPYLKRGFALAQSTIQANFTRAAKEIESAWGGR